MEVLVRTSSNIVEDAKRRVAEFRNPGASKLVDHSGNQRELLR